MRFSLNCILLFFTVVVFAQKNNKSLNENNKKRLFSVNIAYPYSLETATDYSSKSTGIKGFGFDYCFKSNKRINIGTSYSFDYYLDDYMYSLVGSTYNHSLKYALNHFNLFLELKYKRLKRLRSHYGFGYTFVREKKISHAVDSNLSYRGRERSVSSYYGHGINTEIGLEYDVSSRLFMLLYFQYSHLLGDPDTYNMSHSFLKTGIGYKF